MVVVQSQIDMDVWEMAGPLSPMRRPDAGDHWITINPMGKCNHPVRVPEHVAKIMRIRLDEWLNCDLADYAAFSMCQLTGGNCAAGFVGGEKHVPTDCPFSVVKDDLTGKHGCCYTVLADGVCVMDLLEVVSAYLDGEGPAPRKVEKFRKYCRAMLNFYKAQVHDAWKGESDAGSEVSG